MAHTSIRSVPSRPAILIWITAPTVYLTAVARETSRLRIGAMMWQLPFYNPLRLAKALAADYKVHVGAIMKGAEPARAREAADRSRRDSGKRHGVLQADARLA